MLESVLADVLTRVLGQYLEGIDRQSVTFGAWSGLVELRSVALRPEALAVLFETLGVNLPVTVEAGFIGLLRLNVPWNAIGTTPVLITLEDISIIARPVRGDGSDDSELQLRERRIKRARLNTDDAVREASWGVSSETENKPTASWSTWLVSDQLRAKVIDNIQVHLKDIIIRFEDPFSDPQRPYLTSVVCESLKIVSANELWNEAFVERGDDHHTRKLMEVSGFRVDWAPITHRDQPGASLSTDGLRSATSRRFQTPELLRQFVMGDASAASSASQSAQAESLISPIDGFMRILLSPDNAPTVQGVDLHQLDPTVDLDIRFPNVTCNLNDVQYTSLLQTSVYFARLATRGVRPKTAKARWVWAIDQLLPGFSDRRKRALRLTEAGMAETRTKRMVYAAYRKSLLKARRTGVEEPSEIAEQLENIEASTSYEEIIAFRDWVDRLIDTDHEEWQAIAKKEEKPEPAQVGGTTTSTFWRMLGYADEQEDEKKQQSQSSDSGISTKEDDDQKQVSIPEPGKAEIDSIAKDSGPHSQQRISLTLRVAFLLRSVTLNLSQGGFPRESIARLSCTLQNLRVGVLVSSANDLITEAVLGSVEVWDVQKNAPLVYNRFGMAESSDESLADSAQSAYPADVNDALESIRDGSNPASEVLMHQEAYSDQESDTSVEEYHYDEQLSPSLTSETTQSTSSGSRRKRTRTYGSAVREATPPTFRVTEEEFVGTRTSSSLCRYAAAFRYKKQVGHEGIEDLSAPKTYLDVSIATLEAVVDGPKGSFVWGLKFWRPRGMAQDPIMAFLGAAAGARIAELRMEIEEALVANKVPLQINAVILAPRFIIPGGKPSSPAIVVNMGTIGVCTSDNAPSFNSSEREDFARRIRYSNYVMTLDNLGMYYCPSLVTALSRSPRIGIDGRQPSELHSGSEAYTSDTSGVERIIRPFSLRFMVQTLRDATIVQVARHASHDWKSTENNIAKVRVRGTIPDVSLILTQAAFQHLLITVDKWSRELLPNAHEKMGNEDGSTVSNWPVSHGSMGHSSTSLSAVSSNLHIHEGQKHEASSKEPLPTALASYDVRLLLNRVSVELRDRAEMRLLTLMAYQIQGEVVKTGRTNLKACFSLQSWSVTDGSRGSTAAYRRLVYAGNLSGARGVSPPRSASGTADSRGQEIEEDRDFITIRYDLDFRTGHQQVQIHFLSLNVICVRETYIKLARYFRGVREYVKANRVKRRSVQHIDLGSPHGAEDNLRTRGSRNQGHQDHQNELRALRHTYIISLFDGFNFQLIASGGVVAVFEMRESKIQYLNEGGSTSKAWGECRYFSVRDLTSPVREHISVISYEKPEPVMQKALELDHVSGEQLANISDEWVLSIPRSRGAKYELSGNFRGIKITLLYRFCDVILQYFNVLWEEVEPIVKLVVDTENDTHDQAWLTQELKDEKKSNFVINLVLNDLTLRLPRHSACPSEALNIGIQDICISNSVEDGNSNKWSCRLTDAQFAVEYLVLHSDPSSPISVSSSFLTNFMADIVVGFGYETHAEAQGASLQTRVEVWFKANRDVFLSLSEAQYTVLYFVLTENLAETVTELDLSLSMDCLMEDEVHDVVQAEARSNPTLYAAKHKSASDAENTNAVPQLQKPKDVGLETFVAIASFPSFVLEVSRGWDVTRECCKVLGIRLKNLRMLVKRFTPRRLVIELDARLLALEDLRPESRRLSSEFAVPIIAREGFEPAFDLGKNDLQQNLSMVYDKEGVDRPAIFVMLSSLQFDIPLDLFRDATYLAVPGWPFLESSAFPPDFVYLGRTLNIVMNNNQLLLRTYQHDRDRRAVAVVGEFEVKMEWMRHTGAKVVSLETRQMEVSCINEIRPLGEEYDVFGVKSLFAHPIEASTTPLLYPSSVFVEYIGPLADEKGCRLHLSSEALLCLVNASDISLLRAVCSEISRKQQSYLSRRAWKQASYPRGKASAPVEPKELQRRKALASMNVSMDLSAVRCLLSDDARGQFVPVLETQIASLLFSSHSGNITQIEGVASMDLFNSEKGWWEPALEPWRLAASISHGQSGAKSYIIRSDERADFNITPTTITAVLTVLKTLSTPARTASSSSAPQIQKLFVRDSDSNDRPAIAAFLVRNELGVPVNVNLPSTSHRITIIHGSEIEVQAQSESLVSSGTERSRISRESALRCSLTIPSYFSKNVSASEVGIFPLAFFPTESGSAIGDRKKLYVVWEVKMSKGVPLCTLRSQYRVLNRTKRSMEIFVSKANKDRPDAANAAENSVFLDPGEAYSVPVQYTKNEILVRPVERTRGGISSLFEWSSPMPSMKWLRRVARDLERNLERNKSGAKQRSHVRSQCLVCKALEKGSCDFFMRLEPRCSLSYDSNRSPKQGWIDVALLAPIVLKNDLPGSLFYKITQSGAVQNTYPGSSYDYEETILAAGKICSLQTEHLHFSGESMTSCFLSLAYDNLPNSYKSDKSWIPEFGRSVDLLDVESGRVKAVSTAPETRSAVARGVGDLRCAISPEESVSGKFMISVGLWVRNRSDTALEVSSRSTFYGTGSNSIILRSRPPFKKPDGYVCLEGPYLSLRLLTNSSEVRTHEESDQGKWWTTPSSLLEAKKPITVNLPGRSLVLELGTAAGLKENTRLVTIRNESWILNCTTTPLQWCQASALDAHGNCPSRYTRILKPGGANAVHWEPKSSSFKAVHLRVTEEHGQSDWIWSPAIPLNIGFSRELPAKMYRPKTHEQYIARVDSKKIGRGSRALVVFPEDRQNPPYRIVNLCKERAVAFSQLGSHERPWLVRGGKSTRYSWDDPLASPDMRKLSFRILEREDLQNARSGSTPVHDLAFLSIDVVGERVMVLSEGYEPNVYINVAVEGATKIVTFVDAGDEDNLNSKETSPEKKQSRRTSSVSSSEPVPVVAWDDISHTPDKASSHDAQHVNDASIAALCDYPLKDKKPVEKVYYTNDGHVSASIFLSSIGVSLTDAEPVELVYIRAEGIFMSIESTQVTQSASVHIGGFQVDNQLHQTLYPVLLSVTNPQADPGRSFAEEAYTESGAIALTIQRTLTNDDIIMIKNFQAAVNPFHLSLEDKLITRLIRFLADTSIVGKQTPLGVNDRLDEDLRIFRSILPEASGSNETPTSNRQLGGLSSSKRIYVHDFKINSSVLRLTSVGSGAAVAKAAGVGLTASAILGLVLNVENCEFQLAALEVQNVFDSVHHFAVLVKEYYLSQLSNQRMKLLASNALMGNPAALFDAVGTGAKDFFNEPGKAKGSAEFIASVGRGSKSLVSHTVGGIMESVSSIPRAVSSGLEKAVGDNAYLAERQRIRNGNGQRNQVVRNPAQGFATGALSFAHGISSGVTGFIREPVQGARQGGAGGLLKGIGKAFIGGVAKPVAGAIDLVAEPAAGLSRQIADDRSWQVAIPERPPRAFRGQSRRLDVYDRRYAVGVSLFKAVQSYNNLPLDTDLIDWVELSEREGRSDDDADLWAWSIIRQFARSMPGWKKQLESSQSRSRAGSSLETRVEKTRAALITESDVIVATLDCKLVAWVALWADAKYDVWSDGKDIVLSGQMVENGGEDARSGIGAGNIVNAPWDVPSVERKRRPRVGERFEERIACGSSSASDDVRKRLAKVVQRLQEEREGKQEMWSGIESASRSQELLALGGSLDDDNQVELRAGKRTSAGASQLGRLGRPAGGGWRNRDDKKQKQRSSASLERTVRRLVGTSSRRGTRPGGLRFVVANRLEGNMILVVREGRLDGTTWSGELAKEIEAFDAQVVETERAEEGVEVAGCVVYDILNAQRKRIGEVVVELFCGKDGAASFTTKASHGFHADFEKEGRRGAFVFYIRESGGDVVGARSDGGGHGGGVESAARVGAEAVSDERLVQQLVEIGFKFEDAVAALAEAEGDMVKAVDLLTK